jgi:rhodanese-related sulfurtransferase
VKPLRLTVSVPAKLGTALENATGVFHRFIQRGLVEGFILDVADYRHVPNGPGLMLIGQDLDYGITPSALYVTIKRRGVDDAATQFRDAVRILLGAVEQINEDGALPTEFDLASVTVSVADRKLGTPDEIVAGLLAEIEPVAVELFGDGTTVTAVTSADPRDLPRIALSAANTDGILAKLGGNQAAKQGPWDISARELARLRNDGADFALIDVREPGEYETVNIGGTLIPLDELDTRINELDPASHVVAHCRAGYRGAQAVEKLRAAGFSNAWNVNGGLMAWIDYVDPSLPRY